MKTNSAKKKYTPTYAQFQAMERLPKRYGNTNSTMGALEKRGLVQVTALGEWYPMWKLTAKGRAALRAGRTRGP